MGEPIRGVIIQRFPREFTSPAEEAGLRVGDRITTFDGIAIHSTASLMRHIGESEVGSVVPIEVVREGQEMEFDVKLARRKASLPR